MATALPGAPRDATVQSLARGLAVIRAFDARHPVLTLSEVAQITNLTRAAARRFLLTLVDLGYVRQEGRDFSLRPRVLELGYSYLSALSLPEVASRHLEALVYEVDESSSMAVLDEGDVIYVARVHTRRIMTVQLDIGTRLPAYATSMGRVLLADLPADQLDDFVNQTPLTPLTPRTLVDPDGLRALLADVHQRGYALNDEELEVGLRSCAAPVRNRDGVVVAAVNIAVSAHRVSAETMTAELVPPLCRHAQGISRDLGWRP